MSGPVAAPIAPAARPVDLPEGVGVLDGFATTADAFRLLLRVNGLGERLSRTFAGLDAENLTALAQAGEAARSAVLATPLPDEGRRVLAAMAANGLAQGVDGLEVYVMCEIPANVVLGEEFLSVFDGFSIGSNDLTQLTLGIDRDSGTVAHLFDERNNAVRWMLAHAIEAGRKTGKPVGICGQAPSDYPELAAWLVERGISSISVNPDVAIRTAIRVAPCEGAQRPGGG
jgi:phosphoenolpyruvate synthase/pyruvate phosphate dikinase